MSWSENVHVIWILSLDYFLLLFLSGLNTVKMQMQWAPCVRKSSYSFMLIFMKLCRFLCHGLKMCIWFGYYQIIFVTIFEFGT